MYIEKYTRKYLRRITDIWNDAINEGKYFPQEKALTLDEAQYFFENQDFTGVALLNNEVVGVYVLHPNSLGRISHVANASYAVEKTVRGKQVGKKLVLDSIKTAKYLKYKLLQFNAVVATNKHAIQLYEKIGFIKIGRVPNSYKNLSGEYEDLLLYYIEL